MPNSEIFFTMNGGNLTAEVGQGDTDPLTQMETLQLAGGTIADWSDRSP